MINNQKTKVSILVPCCNVEKYVEECLESIVNQTLKEIEIICINDGSKDDTLAIIQEYAKKDPRILIIDKPNSGYGDSMNKGLAAATGEYIGIVESDDWIEPEMFEKLYKTAHKNDVDVVKSNFWFYWTSPERNELHEYFRKEECGKIICPSTYDTGSLYGRKPSIWSAIYKREFLTKNGIDFLSTPGASFQDTSFTFKVYSAAKTMVCVYDSYLHYRQDNSGSSVNNADKKYSFVFKEYAEIEKFVLANKKEKETLYPIFAAAFYDTCIWMYELLSTNMKYPYLLQVSEWFNRILSEVDVEDIDFRGCWWKARDIQRIAKDPFEYHVWRYVEKYEQSGNKNQFKKTKTPLNNVEEVIRKQKESMKKPYFSVIVPVFNNEKFLYSCLDSLIYQTFENFEVICVNDGSVDNSLAIMEEYAEMDERFIVVNQENSGPAKTRNVGLSVANGEYILFLDSDDYYALNTCERIQKEIQKKKPEAVIFGTELFPIDPPASPWHYEVLTTPDAYYTKVTGEQLLTTPYLNVYSWRCCFSNAFLKNNQILFNEEFKYGEDALFMLECIIKLNGISVISDKLYHYRHFNADSLMNKISRDPLEYSKQQIRILKQVLKTANKNGIENTTRLLEYACDFIYSSIDRCPEPYKKEAIEEFLNLLKSNGLEAYVDSASDNCRGFIEYCYAQRRILEKERSLKNQMKKKVLKVLPPSRQAFYDYSCKIMENQYLQQSRLDQLHWQVQELKHQLYLQSKHNENLLKCCKEMSEELKKLSKTDEKVTLRQPAQKEKE